jgi:hypothetical protein
MKTADKKIYSNKKRKVFFRNEEERNLWIRLNAERIRYSQKILNNIDEQDLGSIDKPYSHLWVSNNQLTYDEYMEDAPRLSLAELSAMNHNDLLKLSQKRNQETIKKIFKETFTDDNFIVFGENGDFL